MGDRLPRTRIPARPGLARLQHASPGALIAVAAGVDPVIANSHGARFEQRVATNIAVRLHWNRRAYESYTQDVSRRGLRVVTHADPTVPFLVKLELALPADAEPIILHAMVVHVARGEQDLHNQVGMRLYGIGDEDRLRWGHFIDSLARPTGPQPVRRLRVVDPHDRARRGSR